MSHRRTSQPIRGFHGSYHGPSAVHISAARRDQGAESRGPCRGAYRPHRNGQGRKIRHQKRRPCRLLGRQGTSPAHFRRTTERQVSLPYPPPFQDLRTLAGICAPARARSRIGSLGLFPPPRKVGGKRLWQWKEVERHLASDRRVASSPDDASGGYTGGDSGGSDAVGLKAAVSLPSSGPT